MSLLLVREAAIDLIRAQGDPTTLPQEEREIVAYAQQLVRTNRVDQAAFDTLQKKHGTQWMVELTAAVNYFGFLCGVVKLLSTHDRDLEDAVTVLQVPDLPLDRSFIDEAGYGRPASSTASSCPHPPEPPPRTR